MSFFSRLHSPLLFFDTHSGGSRSEGPHLFERCRQGTGALLCRRTASREREREREREEEEEQEIKKKEEEEIEKEEEVQMYELFVSTKQPGRVPSSALVGSTFGGRDDSITKCLQELFAPFERSFDVDR